MYSLEIRSCKKKWKICFSSFQTLSGYEVLWRRIRKSSTEQFHRIKDFGNNTGSYFNFIRKIEQLRAVRTRTQTR